MMKNEFWDEDRFLRFNFGRFCSFRLCFLYPPFLAFCCRLFRAFLSVWRFVFCGGNSFCFSFVFSSVLFALLVFAFAPLLFWRLGFRLFSRYFRQWRAKILELRSKEAKAGRERKNKKIPFGREMEKGKDELGKMIIY